MCPISIDHLPSGDGPPSWQGTLWSTHDNFLIVDLIVIAVNFCSVEHFDEPIDATSHSCMHVGLRALDMVVEIVSEERQVADA